MPTRTIPVTNDTGLHARPAAEVADAASDFDAAIVVSTPNRDARASSPLELTALGVDPGETVTVTADGPDATAALDAIAAILDGAPDTTTSDSTSASDTTESDGDSDEEATGP